MKHHTTRALFAYWNRLRRDRAAPERKEIEPAEVRALLGDMFIVEIADRDNFMLRLAGTRLCSAFCQELKGRNLLDLWSGDDREALNTLLWSVADDASAAVAGWRGRTARGQALDFELILLPLRHHGRTHSRILGAASPLDTPYWFGSEPVVEAELTSLRILWPDTTPGFLAANPELPAAPIFERAPPSARIRHLAVYDGGRL